MTDSQETHRFEAYDLSIELVAATAELATTLRRHSRSLADQLARAVQSVPLNLAEGAERRGADRLHHYRIAAGSLAECRAVLDVAVASGWLAAGRLGPARDLLDREAAMLFRLTHPRR